MQSVNNVIWKTQKEVEIGNNNKRKWRIMESLKYRRTTHPKKQKQEEQDHQKFGKTPAVS